MTTKRRAKGGQGQETALSEHSNISLLRKIYARERTGRRLDMPAFGIWRFDAGRIAEHGENPLDIPAFDAFWK